MSMTPTSALVLPQKWQDRFAFFDQHGAPNTPAYKAALKSLPTFGEKMKVNFNWIAFFFGPIYMFILGLWKKALIWIAAVVVLNVACYAAGLSVGAATGIGVALRMAWGMTANYHYYLKQIKARDDWNILDGMGM